MTVLAALQVVVDAVDPSVLVSRTETKLYDFGAIDEEELHDIVVPLDFQISESAVAKPCSSSTRSCTTASLQEIAD